MTERLPDGPVIDAGLPPFFQLERFSLFLKLTHTCKGWFFVGLEHLTTLERIRDLAAEHVCPVSGKDSVE